MKLKYLNITVFIQKKCLIIRTWKNNCLKNQWDGWNLHLLHKESLYHSFNTMVCCLNNMKEEKLFNNLLIKFNLFNLHESENWAILYRMWFGDIIVDEEIQMLCKVTLNFLTSVDLNFTLYVFISTDRRLMWANGLKSSGILAEHLQKKCWHNQAKLFTSLHRLVL